jgi:hypothetical protein
MIEFKKKEERKEEEEGAEIYNKILRLSCDWISERSGVEREVN